MSDLSVGMLLFGGILLPVPNLIIKRQYFGYYVVRKLITTYFEPLIEGRPAWTNENAVGKKTRRPAFGVMLTPWLRNTVSPPSSTSFKYKRTARIRCGLAAFS
jgi:hypothetical protein